ncbi:MAG TPA: phospholipase D-like domain-containing protein [Thermoanaerobaculia bacterium]|nr:phospholipase D-like domain-containing protein [Thermoanaerobaculia bacterium]
MKKKKFAIPRWLIALGYVPLLLMIWSIKRRSRPRLELEPTDNEDLAPSIAGLTQGTIAEGNRIELLQNGAMWDRLFADMENAKKTINFETFLCKEGELTRRMTETLLRKLQEKVLVRVLIDGSGGKHYGKDDLDRLREAGAKVEHYHPVRISNVGRINNRDHRKLCIVDGRIGYIGGHCLVDSWMGEAQDKKHFRDITARAEGPVVAQLQAAFAENWMEENGEVPGGTNFFPRLERAGDVAAHAVWVSPTGSPSSVKLLHYLLIHSAKKSITIQNPYFLPDPDARKALLDAVKRGAEVRVMIPATEASDSAWVQHASHHHYGTLLKGGVKLFDYHRTLLHQKVMVIDGCWSSIGSTNFDDRSFELNDEVSLVIYDEGIARELEETFERDREHATEVHFDEWKRRPVSHKLKDFSCFVFNEQL